MQLEATERRPSSAVRCATCGMELVGPGIVRGARQYCCRGCTPAPGVEPGALRPAAGDARGVGAIRAVSIAAPVEEVRAFLADVELLHLYEQKLARLRVTGRSPDGKRWCATADGQFGALPYHIELHFRADQGGYDSTLCSGGPIEALSGTFDAEPGEQGTIVTHEERYRLKLGAFGRALGLAFLEPYIGWSMERELRTLKRLVEEPSAVGEALRLRDPRRFAVDPRVPVWDPRAGGAPKVARFRRAPSTDVVLAGSAFLAGVAAGALLLRRR